MGSFRWHGSPATQGFDVTIEFHCPFCQKLLKTAEDKAGVRANCPGCGEAVTVPSPAGEAARVDPSLTENLESPARASTSLADVPVAAETTEDAPALPGDMRPCPMCGAQIR